MLVIAPADPAENVGIVKIVFLFPVRVAAAGFYEFPEVRYERPVLYGVPVIIGIEDARRAGIPEQDQGVGERFEPVFDKGLQALPDLGVVVVDEGDGVSRILRDQRAVEICRIS